MTIRSINDEIAKLSFKKPEPIGAPEQTEKTADFGQMFTNAIKEVDELQKTANDKITDVVAGKSSASPHEAMIAMEKADVAFTLMNQIRSKIIRAYEEVMRTQI